MRKRSPLRPHSVGERVKHLRYRSERSRVVPWPASRPRFSLDPAASSAIAPPWPDLVIGCGRRSASVALDIRAEAGPATRLVQLGRPRTDLDAFDLIVTTPQYCLPDHPNVMRLDLPMHRVDRTARKSAMAVWRWRFGSLPRPWIAVLLGGATHPYVFPPAFAKDMARRVNALAQSMSASLLVTTSRRTPEEFTRAFCSALEGPSFVYGWREGSADNPYLAYLELADAFVVTGDSASMLAETCGTGRRVWFVEPPTCIPSSARLSNWLGDLALRMAEKLADVPIPVVRRLSRAPVKGWIRHRRDLSRLHAALIANNRALPLGRSFATSPPLPEDEVEEVAVRVAALLDTTK